MGKLDLFSVPLPLLPRCIWVWHEVGDVYIAACSGSITRVEGRQLVCSPEPESILGLATCTMLGIGSPTLFTDGMTRYVTGVPCGFGGSGSGSVWPAALVLAALPSTQLPLWIGLSAWTLAGRCYSCMMASLRSPR